MTRVSQQEMVEKAVTAGGTVVLLGGIDTGKTSFGLSVVQTARDRGMSVAYIDSDIGQSTVGPPTCIGLKYCTDLPTIDPESIAEADELAFVGSTSPEGHLLPMITGTTRLVTRAREAGTDLIVLDTSSYISGFYAEVLKYHKLEVLRPDSIIGFERGEELEPILGIVQRFLPVEVTGLKVSTQVVERSAEERLEYRESRLASYFKPPLSRWRLKTSVFMPTIPPGMDLSLLDGLVVGLEDGKGTCRGIGLLEYDSEENFLRMVSSVTESATGLKLGSIKITTEGRTVGRVSLRELFG